MRRQANAGLVARLAVIDDGDVVEADAVPFSGRAFLGQTDQEMLRTDIGMAEFIGGHEGAAERILHARRHADLRDNLGDDRLSARLLRIRH